MKRNTKQNMILNGVLTISFIGMILSGCGTDKPNTTESNVGQEITPADVQAHKTAKKDTVPGDHATDDPAERKSEKTDVQTDTQESLPDSQDLYEEFLQNAAPATISYSKDEYRIPIFESGSSYTMSELGTRVSGYFLDPEYSDKTSYDFMQYAYVDCPDSTDADAKNLLVKFVGLNIYAPDDDSYAVFIITENNGQLYVSGEYECWARSETKAYANGILRDSGSGGAGDHYDGLSVIRTDGAIASIYSLETLNGWWTSYVNDTNDTIYNEIFGEDMQTNLIVYIYTIGSERYYQYDMSKCMDEEYALCEDYIDRCRNEAGINWVTDEELRTAINNQCDLLGIDYGITQEYDMAVWNNINL